MPENNVVFTRLAYSERCEVEQSLDAGITVGPDRTQIRPERLERHT